MSALMAERRELGEEGRQESLFGAPAPPRAPEPATPWAEPPAPPPPRQEVVATPADEDELARLEAFAPAPEALREAPLDEPPFEASVDALVDEPFAAPATEEVGERRVPRTAGMPLAGPTLDDVMSRVWEGLATGLPAACPLCHGEVEPAPGAPLTGRCRSCGTSIH
jgi:hypothetical protein